MRIGILTASFLPMVGGMEWKVHYLATEYMRAGHDVIVFAIRQGLRKEDLRMPVQHSYRVLRTGLSARGFGRLGINVFLFKRAILREHRRQPFDVLHVHPLGFLSYAAAKVRSRFGVPVVVTTSGADVLVNPALNYGDRLIPHVDRMICGSLNQVDVVGCISEAIRQTLEEIGTTAQLVDIPNGVVWKDFQQPRGSYLRDRLKIPADSPIVLSVGRYTPIKDYSTTLKAFAILKSRHPNCAMVIVGRGISQLRLEADALGLSDGLHLLEQVPISEVPQIMHSADVFVNTSLMEGFAQVNAQALACGLPCVFTDSPGNIDAARYGGGLVAETGNPTSVADVLERLVVDGALRIALGKSAFEAGKSYDWTNIANQYLAIFERLAQKRVLGSENMSMKA